jgi:hypothetical protein
VSRHLALAMKIDVLASLSLKVASPIFWEAPIETGVPRSLAALKSTQH